MNPLPPVTSSSVPTRWQIAAAGILLSCYLALGLSASLRKSQTGDEGAHLAGGMTYWEYNDYRVQPENGNLPQRLCALPIWLASWQVPDTDEPTWREREQWDFADKLIYESGNDADRMLLEGRLMTALVGAALALFVFAWSRRLFGVPGGLVSLTLYAFSPTMLTHGFLITSDMASAFFFLAAVGALWQLLHRISAINLLVSWLALSGLFLSKFSAPLIVPMAAIMLAVRLVRYAPLPLMVGRKIRLIRFRIIQALLFAGISVVLAAGVLVSIWAAYGFRYSMCNPRWGEPSKPLAWTDVVSQTWEINTAVRLAREYQVLPEAYLYGFSHVMHHSEARNAFLNGEFRRYGWPMFFPFCLLVKTPLELFALLGLALAAMLTFRPAAPVAAEETGSVPGLLYRLTPLVTLFVIYWLFALKSHLNIGHRHLLPTYPPLLIFAGASAWWLCPPRMSATVAPASRLSRFWAGRGFFALALRGCVALALILMVAEALWFWPHYLAYFNRTVGGPRFGYKHLADSSLDWSQDLKELKNWLDAHPEDTRDPQRLYFSFYGSPPPEYYGIKIQRLPSFPMRWMPHTPRPLTGGTYIISATMLDAVMFLDAGRWNEEYESRLRNLQQSVNAYVAMSSTPAGLEQLHSHAPENEWQDMFKVYETLRLSRLTSFLRQREPDDEIGYSILVYRLSDAEVALAVDGPPVELLEVPEWQLEDRRLRRTPE